MDFPKLERKILKLWEKEKTFEKTLEARAKAPRFVFFEGPPTANGRPGIHHVLELRAVRGFTLLELIIVIAILAVLAVAVVVVLNPAQLLARSRDSTRLTDLGALRDAINLVQTMEGGILDPDGPSYTDSCSGESSQKLFVSVPSDNGETSPPLPPNWSWNRVLRADAGLVDGGGWMPVDLKTASTGSPLSNLPVDPTNTFASGLYYTYTCSRNPHFELTARFEAQENLKGASKDKVSTDGGDDPYAYELGTNLQLDPMAPTGSWALDEGQGTLVRDSSKNKRDGTLQNFVFDVDSGWRSGSACKSSACLQFGGNASGGDDQVTTSNILNPTTTSFTAEAWVNADSFAHLDVDVDRAIILKQAAPNGINWLVIQRQSAGDFRLRAFSGSGVTIGTTNWNTRTGQWHHIAVSFDGTTSRLYLDGVFEASSIPAALSSSTSPMYVGRSDNFSTINEEWDGLIDELRIYNRVMAADEIQQHAQN